MVADDGLVVVRWQLLPTLKRAVIVEVVHVLEHDPAATTWCRIRRGLSGTASNRLCGTAGRAARRPQPSPHRGDADSLVSGSTATAVATGHTPVCGGATTTPGTRRRPGPMARPPARARHGTNSPVAA
jgi:hypothetical protein